MRVRVRRAYVHWGPAAVFLAAGVAAAFDLYLDVVGADGARDSVGAHDLDRAARQARHVAAVGAEKVRVRGVRLAPVANELEAPDVVAEVRSRDQAGVDQIDEVAVNRGAVVAGGRELLGDLGVAHGACGGLEPLEYRDPRRGAAKAGGAKGVRQLRGGTRRALRADETGGLGLRRHVGKIARGAR